MSAPLKSLSRIALAIATAAVCLVGPSSGPAAAVSPPPPGANDWSCKPTAVHPFPVVLVNGTFEGMAKNWVTMSPFLKARGYCVFAFDYGETNGVPATGPVAESAKELRTFVNRVLTATGKSQVDLVGHSQGGMMPRHYMRFLGGRLKVHHLIGLAPSNHGTDTPILPPPPPWPTSAVCQACLDQQAGSPFLTKLNADKDIVWGPFYTVIATRYDEVVTPYTSQALAGPKTKVTNLVLQDLCPADVFEHDQMPNDPVAQRIVAAALAHEDGPARPGFQPSCL